VWHSREAGQAPFRVVGLVGLVRDWDASARLRSFVCWHSIPRLIIRRRGERTFLGGFCGGRPRLTSPVAGHRLWALYPHGDVQRDLLEVRQSAPDTVPVLSVLGAIRW